MRQFTRDISDADGQPFPVRMQHRDGSIIEDDGESEAAVLVLPHHIKHSLHRAYLGSQAKMENHVALSTFINVLCTDMSHVRVSLRAFRVCDILLMYSVILIVLCQIHV